MGHIYVNVLSVMLYKSSLTILQDIGYYSYTDTFRAKWKHEHSYTHVTAIAWQSNSNWLSPLLFFFFYTFALALLSLCPFRYK